MLNDYLCKLEDVYGKYPSEVTPELRFKGIIERIAKKHNQRVVILVDEYDKPMRSSISRMRSISSRNSWASTRRWSIRLAESDILISLPLSEIYDKSKNDPENF